MGERGGNRPTPWICHWDHNHLTCSRIPPQCFHYHATFPPHFAAFLSKWSPSVNERHQDCDVKVKTLQTEICMGTCAADYCNIKAIVNSISCKLSARRHSATTDSVYHAWRSLSSTVHDKHGKQTALNFSLCNFGKTFNSTWLRCVKQRELLFNLSVDITMQTARDDHNKQHTVRLGHYWCCPLLAMQGLCNGRVSTCPSVTSTAATFQSISPPTARAQ